MIRERVAHVVGFGTGIVVAAPVAWWAVQMIADSDPGASDGLAVMIGVFALACLVYVVFAAVWFVATWLLCVLLRVPRV